MRAVAATLAAVATLFGTTVLKGDLNADGTVDATDAWVSLAIALDLVETPSGASGPGGPDVNDDGRADLGDTVLILLDGAGLGSPGSGGPPLWDAFHWNLARWG